MSALANQLREEQKRFEDTLEYYRTVEVLVRAKKLGYSNSSVLVTCIVGRTVDNDFYERYSLEQLEEMLTDAWSMVFTRIPSVYLNDLHDFLSSKHISMPTYVEQR